MVHKLPRTLTGLTEGGGLHLLYRARFQQRVRNRTSGLRGMRDPLAIHLRGDGGYVVAPPSIHVSGNRYSWLDLGALRQVVHPHCNYEGNEDQDHANKPMHASTLPASNLTVLPGDPR